MSNLNEFVIADGKVMKYIGSGGTVVVPEGVTEIGEGAFKECRTIKSVVIPETVTRIGKGAFQGCRNLKEASIPYSVTVIRSNAFCDCRSLMHIELPESLQNVENECFLGCNSLESVSFPRGMVFVGFRSFRGCVKLVKIELPEGVLNIGCEAFYGCTGLSALTIPSSIMSIGEMAFSGCKNLEDVKFMGSITQWRKLGIRIEINYSNQASQEACVSIKGQEYSFNGFSYTRVQDNTVTITDCSDEMPSALVIPDTIEGLPVTAIGCRAFAGCNTITHITLPKSMTRIGRGAFTFCRSLEKIELPEGITCIYEETFCECRALKEISLPESLISIERDAFAQDRSLEAIAIPDNLQRIGEGAFRNCIKIWNVQISSDTIKRLGSNEIKRCFITENAVSAFLRGTITCESMKKEIAGLLRNKKYRIKKIYALIEINDIEELGGMLSIQKKLPIEELNEYLKYAEDKKNANAKAVLLQTKNRMFSEEEQNVHEQEREEKELGFKEKTLADWRVYFVISSVLGQFCINRYRRDERKDEVLVIPGQIDGKPVKRIEKEAFAECYNLKTLYIEEGIEVLGDRAFLKCTNLTDVFVPASVREIGQGVFDTQIQLISRWTGSYTPLRGKLVLHAPKGSVAAKYAKQNDILLVEEKAVQIETPVEEKDCRVPRTEAEWKRIYSWKQLTEFDIQITSYKGTDLHVEIPSKIGKKTVRAIGSYAFSPIGVHYILSDQRKKIQTVVIPEGVNTIEERAFYACHSLTAVKIPESLTMIGDSVFSDCESLEEINLPDSIQTIGDTAFHGCQNLWNVHVSEGVLQRIGEKQVQQYFLTPITAAFFLKEKLTCDPIKERILAQLKLKKSRLTVVDFLIETDDAETLERLFALQKRKHTGELKEALLSADRKNKPKAKELLEKFLAEDERSK